MRNLIAGVTLTLFAAWTFGCRKADTEVYSAPLPTGWPGDLSEMADPIRSHLDGLIARIEELRRAGSSAELADTCLLLGQLLLSYERHEAARNALECVSQVAPESLDSYYYLGIIDVTLDPQGARQAFERVLESEPRDAGALLRLADLELVLGDLDSAERYFREALESDWGEALAERGLGLVALERDDARSALEHLGRALDLEPEADRLHYFLGQSLRRLGDTEGARSQLALSGDTEVTWHDPRTRRLDDLRTTTALEVAIGLGLDTAGVPMSDYLGFTFSRLGSVRGAAERFEVEARDPSRDALGRSRLWLGAAGLWSRREEPEKSVESLRAAAAAAPHDAEVALFLGNALARVGRFTEAVAAYTRAVDRSHDSTLSAEASRRSAMASASVGDFARARRQLEALCGPDLDDWRSCVVLSRVMAATGETLEASRILERLQRLEALDDDARVEIADVRAEIDQLGAPSQPSSP